MQVALEFAVHVSKKMMSAQASPRRVATIFQAFLQKCLDLEIDSQTNSWVLQNSFGLYKLDSIKTKICSLLFFKTQAKNNLESLMRRFVFPTVFILWHQRSQVWNFAWILNKLKDTMTGFVSRQTFSVVFFTRVVLSYRHFLL